MFNRMAWKSSWLFIILQTKWVKAENGHRSVQYTANRKNVENRCATDVSVEENM